MKKSIDLNDYLNSLKMAFIKLDSYKEFPDDEKFTLAFLAKDIYKMRIANYILVKLENFDNKEPISYEGYTIEHIMPQNKELSDEWKNALGDKWEEVHNTLLHRIGNLTLTRYNSEMSDKPFKNKITVFEKSATHNLNQFVIKQTTWNGAKIEERANQLATIAKRVWAYPEVNAETIQKYTSNAEDTASKYSIASYDLLATDLLTKMFFDKIDQAILSLNPVIKRECKKLYIAYKYKTNIVDIIPQKAKLRLVINMDFDEVNDPSGICKDVTNLGKWGNGDVEIILDNLGILNEVLDIIKQSLAKQQ